jgi:hypothetical protein
MENHLENVYRDMSVCLFSSYSYTTEYDKERMGSVLSSDAVSCQDYAALTINKLSKGCGVFV